MARAIWTGSITFGLVNIPIKLYTAVREQTIRFNLLHDQDNVRLQQKMVCPADGQEVHPEHRVRGYPVGPDQYVIIRQDELDALAPAASRTIEIRDFVNLEQIDPIYFDRPYYVAPQEHAVKAYRLLLEAMKRSNKIGVATFVMRNKEHLAPFDRSKTC
jgi:DNA end-binding protein Ku